MSAQDVLAGRAQWAIEQGGALAVLAGLPDGCVQCCVTSPPYYGLRDYGTATWEGGDPDCAHKVRPPGSGLQSSTINGAKTAQGHQLQGYRGNCGRCGAVRIDQQIGLEPTLEGYVAALVAVFREVKRVLHPTGTLWLNLSDSYSGAPRGNAAPGGGNLTNSNIGSPVEAARWEGARVGLDKSRLAGVKPKDLLMVPARVALALQADGWWLRSDIIWAKTACMPESVTDRPTSSHEHVFLLAKAATYYYDQEAVREPATDYVPHTVARGSWVGGGVNDGRTRPVGNVATPEGGRNLRNVWTLGPEPLKSDHYAAFPTAIPRRAILAGTRPGDVVLDCFSGSGRTVLTALNLGRRAIGIELSAYQADKSRTRIVGDCPMFNRPDTEAAG